MVWKKVGQSNTTIKVNGSTQGTWLQNEDTTYDVLTSIDGGSIFIDTFEDAFSISGDTSATKTWDTSNITATGQDLVTCTVAVGFNYASHGDPGKFEIEGWGSGSVNPVSSARVTISHIPDFIKVWAVSRLNWTVGVDGAVSMVVVSQDPPSQSVDSVNIS